MLFTTDQQTLEDLNIFGKHGGDSIYQIYNRTNTRGGAALLEEMFRYPLSDEQAINQRSGIIQYFAGTGFDFPFQGSHFDAIEPYLENIDERTKLNAQDHSMVRKLGNLIALDADTSAIQKGVTTLIDLLKSLNTFISSLKVEAGHPYQADRDAMMELLSDPSFATILNQNGAGKLPRVEIAEYDLFFRFRNRKGILKLLRYIYFLDVYCAVAKVAVSRGFTFPKALPGNVHQVYLKDVYHPQVKDAVPNSIEITRESNVIFLTGANMAGKSTFMKSLSIALFLAHMGFPVAASTMEFSVLDGIYTTINLPDNLGMGASHFYAEVLRAKKVANELRFKNLFILFDELFRGTNVKDAGEATIAFTEAFAKKRNSMFVISTHIIEAGEVLKERFGNINFVYLPTLMQGTHPVYTYKLEKGLTADRHGMIIINNEGILKILDEGVRSKDRGAGMNSEEGIKIEEKGKGNFIADKQTLADLNLLGKYKHNSIYSIFNSTRTAGGERLLQEMFQNPLLDTDLINKRISLFKYFQERDLKFPFERSLFERAESYLGMGTSGNYPAAVAGLLIKKVQASFLRDEQFDFIYTGLLASIEMLNVCFDFIDELKSDCQKLKQLDHNPYKQEIKLLQAIFEDPDLRWLKQERGKQDLSLLRVAQYDYLLKHKLKDKMENLLKSIYKLDVYISVAKVARERGFAYAGALSRDANIIHASALWHPALIKGVANPVSFCENENMIFLSGANMAGKSTFMKAFGISVYLAHMGFPVAAKDMKFSVMDGLYSSINVPDDLNMGYSHFYAEVLRVKKVAEEVGAGKNLVLLFDELFKGTNVKDAYDGTLAVTEAFSKYRNCFYIVSTHIIEVGEALQNSTQNLQFAYLPTIMEGNTPKYTYKIEKGITTDRQGMMIIENEGILDILNN